jgi:hypothetical protein
MKRLIVVLAIAYSASIVVVGQKPADNPSDARPYIDFGLIKAGQKTPTQGTGDDLAPGAPVTARFVARSLCETNFGGPFGKLPPAPADARYVFRFAAELLGQTENAYTVCLTSTHLRFAGLATAEPPFEQTLSLRDGDRVTLDMVREATPGCDTPSMTIEARFFVRQYGALVDTVYVADMWLVHKDDSGHEWNQQVATNVDGAVDVPIVFKDVTFPLPKIDPTQDEFTAYLRVMGTLRARPRQDGLVDLEVNAQRRAGLLLPSTTPGAFGLSTHKVIAVRLGETTAIEIPQPSSGMITTALRIGGKMAGPSSGVITLGVGKERWLFPI